MQLTDDQIKQITAIVEPIAVKAARKEIASLCALVLDRSKEVRLTRLEEHNIAEEVVREVLASIFGEGLSDFSGHTKGQEPGA